MAETEKSDSGCCDPDPVQVYTVNPEPFHVLTVTVIDAHNITKGSWVGDLMDTPDPYIILRVPGTPNGKKRTKIFDNTVNPTWNETFYFILDPDRKNILEKLLPFNGASLSGPSDAPLKEVILMDSNYTVDEKLGVQTIDITTLNFNEEQDFTLNYNESTELNVKLLLTIDEKPDLRYSLSLSNEELSFMRKRKKTVMEKLKMLLGDEGPESEADVPVIGLIGSGGGFRAMTAMSGVFKALSNSGILDCLTYIAGLSGSAWYISTLYSHPEFPENLTVSDVQDELKYNIGSNPFWLLGPRTMYRYISNIATKYRMGQPVSFTDFFGHLLGDTLLKDRTDCHLSDQQKKINDGQLPMPLYTCLHVKSNVSARVFQEWMEFSPYEIGIAKYGTFMKTKHFGCKFYKGRVVKPYEESPLHYLQGVWGSAFCILFKRLINDKTRLSLLLGCTNDTTDYASNDNEEIENPKPGKEEENLRNTVDNISFGESGDEVDNGDSSDSDDEPTEKDKTEVTQKGIWQSFIDNICNSSILDTRKGRAGLILNPLRGLSIVNCIPFSPFSPTSPTDDELFKGVKELVPTTTKTLYLVDGGLTFNFPFPLLQRTQRNVSLYLAFDFSSRENDDIPSFKELLLSEHWAKINKCPFPPVSELVKEYMKQPLKECYIFKHPTELNCPAIIYFPLVNINFRQFKEPGVPWETDEEKEFANFQIFNDPKVPYSIYNFKYTHLQFERLSKLVEFNILNNIDIIHDAMIEAVNKCKSKKFKLSPVLMERLKNTKLEENV